MSHTTQISFRIDEDIKKSAEAALNDMGLTMSAAITVFFKKVGIEHRIPFELTAEPVYSQALDMFSDDYMTDGRAEQSQQKREEL